MGNMIAYILIWAQSLLVASWCCPCLHYVSIAKLVRKTFINPLQASQSSSRYHPQRKLCQRLQTGPAGPLLLVVTPPCCRACPIWSLTVVVTVPFPQLALQVCHVLLVLVNFLKALSLPHVAAATSSANLAARGSAVPRWYIVTATRSLTLQVGSKELGTFRTGRHGFLGDSCKL